MGGEKREREEGKGGNWERGREGFEGGDKLEGLERKKLRGGGALKNTCVRNMC